MDSIRRHCEAYEVCWKARLLIVARFAGVRHDAVIGRANVELNARLQGLLFRPSPDDHRASLSIHLKHHDALSQIFTQDTSSHLAPTSHSSSLPTTPRCSCQCRHSP